MRDRRVIRLTDGQRIETSRGAVVPLQLGCKLFDYWRVNPAGIIGRQIGSYTINESSAAGVKIGCHEISAEEINNFFRYRAP